MNSFCLIIFLPTIRYRRRSTEAARRDSTKEFVICPASPQIMLAIPITNKSNPVAAPNINSTIIAIIPKIMRIFDEFIILLT